MRDRFVDNGRPGDGASKVRLDAGAIEHPLEPIELRRRAGFCRPDRCEPVHLLLKRRHLAVQAR
jgi:hypothetical protein